MTETVTMEEILGMMKTMKTNANEWFLVTMGMIVFCKYIVLTLSNLNDAIICHANGEEKYRKLSHEREACSRTQVHVVFDKGTYCYSSVFFPQKPETYLGSLHF